MKKYSDVKIASKIILAAVSVAVLIALIGILGLYYLSHSTDSSKTVLTIVFVLVDLVAIIFGVILARSVSRPMDHLIDIANRIAVGDTEVDIDIVSNSEIGQLAQSLQKVVDNYHEQALLAQRIAAGEKDIVVVPKSSKDLMGNSMLQVVQALDAMLIDATMLQGALDRTELSIRADINRHPGILGEIISVINNCIGRYDDASFWYSAILDAVPMPIIVTTMEPVITFINKAAEEKYHIKRSEAKGKPCSILCTGACNSENCPARRLATKSEGRKRDGIRDTVRFELDGLTYEAETSFIGSEPWVIGHVEVVRDVTAQVKVLNYQKRVIGTLSQNLKLLSEGNLNLDFDVVQADEYTQAEQQIFRELSLHLQNATESISSYVSDITGFLTEMANGNLDISVKADYKGDFAQIKDSLNYIVDSFNEVLSDISNAFGQVASGTKQVSDGSQALSQGSTEQASSIEELTASITEIASQTRMNAENAGTASGLSSTAKDHAIEGNQQMLEMLSSMAEISDSSNNISKIIKVIDDIAFQTNMLALNAAVEAARAGQHGKGFAVVAAEVRNLAARSANAARETTALIEGSIQKVESGTRIANETAAALTKIVDFTERSATLVGEIAVASNEQATGIAQINKGIDQVSKVVQANSATAEESAATAEELSSQSEVLQQLVSKFKLRKSNKRLDDYMDDYRRGFSSDFDSESSRPQISLSESNFGKY